jgi:hypothetical protein
MPNGPVNATETGLQGRLSVKSATSEAGGSVMSALCGLSTPFLGLDLEEGSWGFRSSAIRQFTLSPSVEEPMKDLGISTQRLLS